MRDRELTMRVRHLVLDRDGVLNREAADGGWITDPEQWEWEDGALDGLRMAKRSGVRVSVVTNQSGIGRGVVATARIEAVNRRMVDEAAAAGGRIDAVFVCPHAPDAECECRKPHPGLVHDAIAASGIPASATLLVGDAVRDLEAADAAAIRSALVRTG